jgi:hypothetical protein
MNTLDETLHELVRSRADSVIEQYFFEQNDSVTRDSIHSSLSTVLQEMDELEDFAIIVDASNNTPARIDRNELWVDLAVQPKGNTQFYAIAIRVIPS